MNISRDFDLEKNDDDSSNNNDIELLEDKLNNWLLFLKEIIQKRLYKKALKEIDTQKLMEKYRTCKRGWELMIISIKIKLKIIKNKIIKYNFYIKEKQKVNKAHQINNCKKYLDKIKEEFNELFNNSDASNKKLIQNMDIIDELILCYAQFIYISAFFNKKIGNFNEYLNYLILIIKFYKELNLFIKSANTLFYIQNCYILLSQIYISNNDFLIASDLLNIAIEISFKIILFQANDIYNGVLYKKFDETKKMNKNNNIKSSINDLQLKKVFLNIIIIYLYKGICHENFCNIKKAVKCYKQCDWFASKFLKFGKDNDNLFTSFIFNLKEKGIECYFLLENIIKKMNDYEKLNDIKNKIKINKDKNTTINYTKYYASNYKYKNLIKKLDSLKIKEIDTVSKFSQKKNIVCLNLNKREGKDKNIYLDNMRLLQAYLRNDFKSIIIDMDKIKLFDLDYHIRERIQKKIYRINYDKIMKEKKDKNKSIKLLFKNKKIMSSPLLEKKNNLNIKNFQSIPNISFTPKCKTYKLESYFNLNDSNNINNINNKTIILNKTPKNNIFRSFKDKYLNKKIKSEKKINSFFNKNYLKKRNFIKNIEDKELKFQKLYLLSKKKPNPSIPTTDELAIKRSAYNRFNKIKTLVNISSINSEEKNGNYEDDSNLENSFFKSLNYKTLESYIERRRKIGKENNNNKNKNEIIYYSDNEIEKKNKGFLNDLNEKISLINKIQIRKKENALYQKINNNKRITYYNRYTSISQNKIRNKFILSNK